MGEQDAITAQSTLLHHRERLRMLQTRVDDQRVVRVAAPEHVAVLIKRRVDNDRQFDEISERIGHG